MKQPENLIKESYLLLVERVEGNVISGRLYDRFDNDEEYFVDIEFNKIEEYIDRDELIEGHAFDWKIDQEGNHHFEQKVRKPLTKKDKEEIKRRVEEWSSLFKDCD